MALSEQMAAYHTGFDALKQIHYALEAAMPAKCAIEEACKRLKSIIDEGKLVAVNEEIKTAILSVYNILETADNGLKDESVAALFGK